MKVVVHTKKIIHIYLLVYTINSIPLMIQLISIFNIQSKSPKKLFKCDKYFVLIISVRILEFINIVSFLSVSMIYSTKILCISK